MAASMSNGASELSDGTIYNFLAEFNVKAQTFAFAARTELLDHPVMRVGETGARGNARNMFSRNHSDGKRVWYTANPTKGKQAIGDDGILPVSAGTLIHGHNTVHYHYGTGNGECSVHLIRHLRANSGNTRHDWPDDMIGLLLSVKRSEESAKGFGASGFEQADLEKYRRRYGEMVAEGCEVPQTTKSRFYRKEEKRLLKRLKKYGAILFCSRSTLPCRLTTISPSAICVWLWR
jgi:hypothetical protein